MQEIKSKNMWDSRNEGAWEGWAQLEPLSCARKTQDDLSASLEDSVGRVKELGPQFASQSCVCLFTTGQ